LQQEILKAPYLLSSSEMKQNYTLFFFVEGQNCTIFDQDAIGGKQTRKHGLAI